MLKGLASDITGSADICRPVRDFEKCLAFQYLMPKESIMFSLQSSKEEFTFTNEAMVRVVGENATTTRKVVERFEYKSHWVSGLKFETAGRADRDCEIKFHIGDEYISIDVASAEEPEARVYYKVLVLLGRQLKSNDHKWELTTAAVGHAANALRLGEGFLTKQSDEVASWLQAKYKQVQPRCYRDFLLATLETVRKM